MVTSPRTSATASTDGVIIPSYIAQIAANAKLRLSPKVTIPGFAGLGAYAITCELGKYGIHPDMSTIALGIIWAMILLGVVVPDGERIVQQSTAHALEQQTVEETTHP